MKPSVTYHSLTLTALSLLIFPEDRMADKVANPQKAGHMRAKKDRFDLWGEIIGCCWKLRADGKCFRSE